MKDTINFPQKMILFDVPRIGWGQIDGRAPTDYSLPGCLGNIICYINEYERALDIEPGEDKRFQTAYSAGCEQRPAIHIKNNILDNMNQMFMNVSGICYATQWDDSFDAMVFELVRINDFSEVIDRCMRYCGRNYTYKLYHEETYDDMKSKVVTSINHGHPVLMEFAGDIPEFSIITGYDNAGDTLVGWAYCSECAKAFEDNGMFRVTDWYNKNIKVVIIGDKTDASLSDKEILQYAIKTMEREFSQDRSYKKFTAGISAYEGWLKTMSDTSNDLLRNKAYDHFLHLMILNIAEPRAYFLGYAKHLSEKYADKDELRTRFNAMVKSSEVLSDYGRAMWGIKDAAISEEEKRVKWCELIKNCIVADKALLENLKTITKLL